MTVAFVEAFQKLYSDMDPESTVKYARSFLFDIARIAGASDCQQIVHAPSALDNLNAKIGAMVQLFPFSFLELHHLLFLSLASGPLHFSYTGWAFVEFLVAETSPENFHIIYIHHHSFEADAWLKYRGKQNSCVCAMNAGYSSGWVQECCAGMELTSMEIQCRGKG